MGGGEGGKSEGGMVRNKICMFGIAPRENGVPMYQVTIKGRCYRRGLFPKERRGILR